MSSVTWILPPRYPSSPGGHRWALRMPRAKLKGSSGELEEGEAMPDMGSRKASWSR